MGALQMKEAFGNMTDLEVSFEELYAVYSKVVARSHTIPVKIEMQPGVFDWKYMPALVPLVDLMNQGIQNTGRMRNSQRPLSVCRCSHQVHVIQQLATPQSVEMSLCAKQWRKYWKALSCW